MKKLMKLIVSLLCVMSIGGLFSACGPTVGDGAYTVTFLPNYTGAESQVSEVKEGETVQKPADPARAGYAFDGWFLETVCVNEYVFDTPVTDHLRLFADWQQTEATVKFYTGAGTEVADKTVKLGEKVTAPATPSREGYIFVGWCTDSLCRYAYDFAKAVDTNLTLYANWLQTEATVTFSLYDSVTTTAKVDIGQKVSKPTDPVREDYAFTGWFADAQRKVVYDFDKAIEGNLILYAGWRLERATVTFDYNYTDAPAAATQKTVVGETTTEPNNPSRNGYEFVSWCTDPTGNNAYDFTAKVDDNLTLYASWKLMAHEVTFDWNFTGSTPLKKPAQHGQTIEVPEETPPANGNKVFVGWFADKACTTAYNFDSAVTGALTLYAKWYERAAGDIVITYFANDGSGAVYHTDNNATQGAFLVRPNEPTRKGYYFAGWMNDSATGALLPNKYPVGGSMNLYAKWLKGYSFEAEHTDLAGKHGQGWSEEGDSAGYLVTDSSRFENSDDMGISNGALVWKLLYNGARLDFEINAEKAVDNAALVLRLTPDGYNYELDQDTYQVLVNGKKINYGHLCMPLNGSYTEYEKRPFENYLMLDNMKLNAGANVISLVTNNNNGHDGTYHAETPYVDCITVYSETTLSWTEGKCHPENSGQTMADVNYAVNYDNTLDRNRKHTDCPLGNN